MGGEIVAICGMPGSGKGELNRLAVERGIPVLSMGDMIRAEAESRGLEETPRNIGEVAVNLRAEFGDGVLGFLKCHIRFTWLSVEFSLFSLASLSLTFFFPPGERWYEIVDFEQFRRFCILSYEYPCSRRAIILGPSEGLGISYRVLRRLLFVRKLRLVVLLLSLTLPLVSELLCRVTYRMLLG